MLSDEQMSKRWTFSLLNDEQMSNKVRVEHQPVMHYENLELILSCSILFATKDPHKIEEVAYFTAETGCFFPSAEIGHFEKAAFSSGQKS